MKVWLTQTIALICAAVCAFTGSLPWLLAAHFSASPGPRGTVWCRYDAQGELIERLLDTNGDGRPDVAEYYGHGILLRRDSDRNFNGVTDLVEDFDADTQQPVRSIIDQDYDGTADLLVLFRNGEPVVVERASAEPDTGSDATAEGSTFSGLVSFRNPFGTTPALDSPVQAARREPWIAGGTADALLASAASVPGPLTAATSLPCSHRGKFTADLSHRAPRGPPLA
jgi:hypothetical protein